MIVKTIQDEIQNYLVDASNFRGNCDAVYLPESAEEVEQILEIAIASKIKVTIAGNHTGLTGSGVPQTGIVLSTEKMNRILEINTKENYAMVEPAVLLKDFQNELKQLGFFYPPDPTETNCFLGGTIATNASGAKTFKYGATRNFVQELEIVLADGDKLLLKRGEVIAEKGVLSLSAENGNHLSLQLPNYKMPKVKNASGYFVNETMDAIDLFIGSEGTLGVITKVKLKILPLPFDVLSCVAFFPEEKEGLAFIEEARRLSYSSRSSNSLESIDARALEFFDLHSLNFLRTDYPQVDEKAACAVWFEQELTTQNEDTAAELWLELIMKHSGDVEKVWIGVDEKDKTLLHEFRHAISSKVNEYISRNNLRKLGTDVAVPDEMFLDYYFYCKSLVEKESLDYVAYGHFGNSHLHLNILPRNEDEFQKGKTIYKMICQKAVELGGTVSAEHGIGKSKREYLLMMYGEEAINEMIALKKVLDPKMILGSGNLFETST
ncbi:MAG: FAD-binding oxidoreductase [Ignavibacteriaceae bacterium]|nr:FAD-binding oxidoreductase [Ignavibacteriaceae bacterium]